MRTATIRNAFFMMAAILGVSYANTASADTGSSPNSSMGDAALHYEHTKGLDTSITTGPIGGTKKIIGISFTATVEPLLRIDPVAGSPLFIVDMPRGAQVAASWTGDKKISLKAVTAATTDGNITVRHTITPDVHCVAGVAGLNFTFDYKATDLINKIPGARFNYDSQASQSFSPWGFTAVDTVLNAPNLADSQLFSTAVPNNGVMEGNIGIRAVTKPTFEYKTTKISLTGADGSIVDASSAVSMNAPDADYFETTMTVEGQMVATGKMDVQPFLHVTHITPVIDADVDFDLPFTAVSKDYVTPPTVIAYPAVNVHVPLPNVHVPKNGIDLGAVKSGGSATKTVTIENSGEKEATLSFKSSDAAFQVPGTSVTVAPKSKYDLQVKLASGSEGAVSADITVVSNDADSPEQTFRIGANGADVGDTGDDGDKDLPSAAQADSGCGCKTAGQTSSIPGYAGFGLLGLGALVFVRRRRNKA